MLWHGVVLPAGQGQAVAVERDDRDAKHPRGLPAPEAIVFQQAANALWRWGWKVLHGIHRIHDTIRNPIVPPAMTQQ